MTDTVNVPREPTREMLNAGANPNYPCDAIDVWRAMLAAAPKAEPVELKDPDAVEQYTDGSKVVLDGYTGGGHALGLWAKLTLRFIAADGGETVREYTADDIRQPEAPKVEQEPVAWQRKAHGGKGWIYIGPENVDVGYETRPLYTHPDPASDELLEALEGVRKALIPCGVINDNVCKALTIADRAIATHKGPKS